MSKPIKKADLLRRVRAMLESRQHARDLDRALAYFEGVQKEEGL
jgi:hypothetical protein